MSSKSALICGNVSLRFARDLSASRCLADNLRTVPLDILDSQPVLKSLTDSGRHLHGRPSQLASERMTTRHERRTLADWTPELGPLDPWLREWERDGWRREYGGDGTDVVVKGRTVRRFAMIQDRPSPTSVATRSWTRRSESSVPIFPTGGREAGRTTRTPLSEPPAMSYAHPIPFSAYADDADEVLPAFRKVVALPARDIGDRILDRRDDELMADVHPSRDRETSDDLSVPVRRSCRRATSISVPVRRRWGSGAVRDTGEVRHGAHRLATANELYWPSTISRSRTAPVDVLSSWFHHAPRAAS